MGIEPTSSAWKAEVLPLNYTRINQSRGTSNEVPRPRVNLVPVKNAASCRQREYPFPPGEARSLLHLKPRHSILVTRT